MKKLLIPLFLAALASPAVRAELPDTLDLSDCRILAGKRYPKAYKEVMDRIRAEAQAGDPEARRTLAGVAANKLVGRLEKYSDNAGWAMIEDSGQHGVVSTQANTVSVATFRNDVATMQALKDACRAAQDLADDDVAYRQVAARYVADYKEAFKDEYFDAYRDAEGARAVACRHPEAITDKTDTKMLCTMARSSAATLYPLIAKDRRATLERQAATWAQDYIAKSTRK
jgi:hypothetical protein